MIEFMAEQVIDETLKTDAKVVAETTEGAKTEVTTETVTATETVVKREETSKKKKNPIVIILMVLFGLVALCAVCGVGGFLLLSKAVQNSPQAVAVKNFYTALDNDDKLAVKNLTTDTLYKDLYAPAGNGDTLANLFKNNVDKVTVTSVGDTNGTGTVEFSLKVTTIQALLGKINYAELQKVGEVWIITYIGPKSDSSATPTEAIDFSD